MYTGSAMLRTRRCLKTSANGAQGLEPLPNTELNVESFKNRVATKRLQVDVPPSCDFIKNVATTRGPEMNKEQIKEKYYIYLERLTSRALTNVQS